MMTFAKRLFIFTLASAAVFFFAGCETEVELNAPYKSTTVIFALLDADSNNDTETNSLDTQWVKINRTFLGDGDNTAYASIRDSSEYDESEFISKKVQRFFDGDFMEEWDLTAITVSNKNINGIFYGPEQTFYYFVPPASGLDEDSNYRLALDFASKEDVTAETDIIVGSELVFQQPQQDQSINLASGTPFNITYPENTQVKWYPASGAKSYDAVLRFHYREITYTDATWTTELSSEMKHVDFNLGGYKVEDISTNSQIKIEFNAESFFSFLGGKLTASPLIRREIGAYDGFSTRCFDLIVSMGNEVLNTYIEVNSPVSGIVQERPSYGNVSNALGIFAARSTRKLEDLKVSAVTGGGIPQMGNLHALCTGTHTAGLNFCDPNPSSDYACD
ncbi:MAG: hypothetical protein ACKVOK_03855 [Flavobacteriales bacterium]